MLFLECSLILIEQGRDFLAKQAWKSCQNSSPPTRKCEFCSVCYNSSSRLRSQASLHLALLKLHSNSTHSGAYMLLSGAWVPGTYKPWVQWQLKNSNKGCPTKKSCCSNKWRWMGRRHLERYGGDQLGSDAPIGHRHGSGHVWLLHSSLLSQRRDVWNYHDRVKASLTMFLPPKFR